MHLLSAIGIKYNSNEFWATVLCDSKDMKSKCWMGDCEICSKGENICAAHDLLPTKKVFYRHWTKTDAGRVQDTRSESTVGDR